MTNIKDTRFKAALSMYIGMDNEAFERMQYVINDHIENPYDNSDIDMESIYMHHAAIELAAKIRFDYTIGLGEVLYEA